MDFVLLLLVSVVVLSTAQDLQFAQDLRDPIYAQRVVDSDGGVLLTDPRFEHVNDIGHPDILSEIEYARRMLALIQLSITDPVNFWWPDDVVSHNARDTIHATAATWRQYYIGPVLELVVHSPFILKLVQRGHYPGVDDEVDYISSTQEEPLIY